MTSDFVEELTWRGLVQQSSDPELGRSMREARFTLYCGFDPTADSLHVGSLVPILTLVRAQRAGHRPIALVGGATGLIGDPSGKSEERKLLDKDTLAGNLAGIRAQLGHFLEFGENQAVMANNHDWFAGYGYLDFLRDVGKHFTVNLMLGKESVRARLEDREHGISYTEFSYMLIQAYDFLCLHDRLGCRLQVGGSDQWGNITAGIELIRRMRQQQAYALTTPLVTTASGQKFGKTEKGTVWLDAAKTTPYDFHQFFLRTDDRDVGRFLRYYTFLDAKAVAALDEQVRTAPEKREAQRVLAREVTTLVHGASEAAKAEQAAEALFATRESGGALAIPPGAPTSEEPRSNLEGSLLVDLLVRSKLSASKGAARRDIAGGGIYLNDERVDDAGRVLHESDVREGNVMLLRKGKKSYHLVRLV
jgi:tyrosyl-tRNA synthetase